MTARRPAAEAARMGRLAERTLPAALGLAALVHGDGDRAEIGEFLAALSQQEMYALAVVLAGLVPVGATAGDLLSYVTWDEHGHPLGGLNDQRRQQRERRVAELRRHLEDAPLHVAAERTGISLHTAKAYRTEINKQQRGEAGAA